LARAEHIREVVTDASQLLTSTLVAIGDDPRCERLGGDTLGQGISGQDRGSARLQIGCCDGEERAGIAADHERIRGGVRMKARSGMEDPEDLHRPKAVLRDRAKDRKVVPRGLFG